MWSATNWSRKSSRPTNITRLSVEKGKRNSLLPWSFNGQKNGEAVRAVSRRQAVLGLGLLGLTTILLLPQVLFTPTDLRVGDLVPNDIRAPVTLEIQEQTSLAGIKPLFYKIRNGELILRAGDRVTPEQKLILDEVAQYQKKSVVLQISLGLALLVAAVLGVFVLDLRRYKPAFLNDGSRSLLLAVLIIVTILV